MVENFSPVPEDEINDRSTEIEKNPEAQKSFDLGVVLGSGWRSRKENEPPRLSIDSRLRTLAAGVLAENGRVNELIFTGGKTAGANYPSESEAMIEYFHRRFPDSQIPIEAETKSFDTLEQAEIIKEIIDRLGEANVLLITNDYHLLRAARDFRHHGIAVTEIPAERVAAIAGHERDDAGHYQKFIEDYLRSCDMKKKQAIEIALRGISKVAPNLLTALAKKLRHGEEI